MDNFQLPTPLPSSSPELGPQGLEQQIAPAGQEMSPIYRDTFSSSQQPMQVTGVPTVQMQSAGQQIQPVSQVSVVSGVPITADDIDLIEKQWVEKAKEIVDKTINDPFLQSKEINKFKAEYIKKRYNKDVKVTE